MAAPPTTPPMHQFIVTTAHDLDLATYHEVEAAYLVEEGRYTVFKDRHHAVVAAFLTDYVMRIRRDDKDAA